MDKIITIDGKDIKFRATAKTPRLYRAIIGRDMIQDMAKLKKSFEKIDKNDEDQALSIMDLQIFEDTAYIMARHANPDDIANSPDEWLDSFNLFSIYEILPQLLELWAMNNKMTSTPKKK